MTARRRAKQVAREQTPSPFAGILARLLRHSPGVEMAALIDPEGETVDYAGELPDYFTKLVSAHFRIVLDDVRTRFANFQHVSPHQVTVRTEPWSFVVRRLPDGYALVVILARRAFTLSARALAVCDDELTREAGWDPPLTREIWFAIEVETTRADRRRPYRLRVGQQWLAVEVLGRVVGLARERAYRCRLRSGIELTLVREPSGQWYSEERIPSSEPEARSVNPKKQRSTRGRTTDKAAAFTAPPKKR